MVNLTTVLAHASGEWIASDWPVCPISETATPHRMGAALTYARRYALFTLVGIAGEDDLDAPDLNAPTAQNLGNDGAGFANKNGRMNGAQGPVVQQTPVRRNGRAIPISVPPILEPDASAALRDQLLTEMERLASAEAAAAWAHQILRAKNTLTAADARLVEEAFQSKMTTIESAHGAVIEAPSAHPESRKPPSPQGPRATVPRRAHFQWYRQEPARIAGAASVARQEPPQIRVQATLPNLWAPAFGSSSRSLRATPCARAQSER